MANVVITGAGRGIGLELVRAYLAAGDQVIALCRSPRSASALHALGESSEGRLRILAADVGDGNAIKAAAAADSAPVDVLINVAGVVIAHDSLEDQDFDAWHDAFEVMTIAPLRVAQAFLPRMREGSRIATISSQLAASTWPYGGYYAYGATKAGSNRVMRTLAIDLRDRGILVASIHPGYVKTDMGGPNAEIEASESAAGIRAVIAALTPATSGDFFKWNGEHHAW